MRFLFNCTWTRVFSICCSLSRKSFDRSPVKFTKASRLQETTTKSTEPSPWSEEEGAEGDYATSDLEFVEFASRYLRTPTMGHQVLIIQPYIKWGHEKKRNTTPELQLAETTALIKTLRSWQVVDSCIISLTTFDRKTFFGKGNLESLKQVVSQNSRISAVFLSVDVLKGYQQKTLEDTFKVPVLDRYRVVIEIFQRHAVTREAKLQVQLAQIPYLWAKANYELGGDRWGSGQTYTETYVQCVKERASRLKNEINKLRSQRELLRKKRSKNEIPVVAVVGYTNSGKTSLIKALTESASLQPEDYLFATLDVTVHEGFLPCMLKVLYADTIGFISDIPTTLLESFVATLEDALMADVIIHVRDVSHPDKVAQNDIVMSTLRGFNLPQQMMDNIIVVDNKVDLVSQDSQLSDDNSIPVSATKMIGLDNLVHKVQRILLEVTDRKQMNIRVLSGGEEYTWLYREAAVSRVTPDEKDPQFSILQCVILNSALERFKHIFIHKKSVNKN